MKEIIAKTFQALTSKEKKILIRLTSGNALISLSDIASLIFLLALVHFYTSAQDTSFQKVSVFKAILLQLKSYNDLLPLLLLLLFFIIKNLLAYFSARAQFTFIHRVALRISRSNMMRYLNGDFSGYSYTDPAVHISSINHQPIEFCTYLLLGMQQLFTELILILISVTAILLFNAGLFLLLLVILLPPLLLISLYNKRKMNAVKKHVKENSEYATQYLLESISSYVESNIYGRQDFFINRYMGFQQKLNKALAKLQTVQAIPSRLIEIFAVVGLLMLILINKYGSNNAVTIINIGAFMAAAYKIIPGITRITNIGAQMRMFAYTVNNVSYIQGEKILPLNHPKERIEQIAIQHVSFSYDDKSLLNNISLQLKSGDFLGISSASGSGKTSLINLLLGFMEPQSGFIEINGRSTTAMERKQLWDDIAYVKQQPFLIHDTIERNITLSENDCDKSRLQNAVVIAGVNELINIFPEGIHKVITDNGKNISGGQRERIALARALYKDAGVIILDEPFSELDEVSERKILRHLQRLAQQGKIIILITHNRSSLHFCNKTFIPDDAQ